MSNSSRNDRGRERIAACRKPCPFHRLLRLSCRRWLLLFPRLLRIRREDRVQRVAFLPRTEFDNTAITDIMNQAFQDSASQASARHLASAEKDRCLDLVAFTEKTQHMVLFGLVIVIVHIDAELHFLDRDRLLMLLGFAFFFLLLVQEFPVIHDAANRGLRCGGNLYQVEVTFTGHLERFKRCQDADLLALIINHANLSRANTLVCADKSLVDTKPPFTLNGLGIRNYSIRLDTAESAGTLQQYPQLFQLCSGLWVEPALLVS